MSSPKAAVYQLSFSKKEVAHLLGISPTTLRRKFNAAFVEQLGDCPNTYRHVRVITPVELPNLWQFIANLAHKQQDVHA
jgi:AraC-like DNA-binding protein